jgi:thiamine-monophosphate kinase
MDEFSLISQLIAPAAGARADVVLGIGDDGALVRPPPGEALVLVLDTLVEAVHFPRGFPPEDIGFRTAASNLSDLAAMGATPLWATLGLTLPQPDAAWVRAFMAGLHTAFMPYQVQLVGGDTTRGPLCISLQLTGSVPEALALRRNGARPGDRLFVSGTLGDAAAGLASLSVPDPSPEIADLRARFARPSARVALGQALRGLATSCIDVSDGLLADLGHLLERSACGAELRIDHIPLSPMLSGMADPDQVLALALTGGDDYELCFTLPAATPAAAVETLRGHCHVTEIGLITAQAGALALRDSAGPVALPAARGYRHFP